MQARVKTCLKRKELSERSPCEHGACGSVPGTLTSADTVSQGLPCHRVCFVCPLTGTTLLCPITGPTLLCPITRLPLPGPTLLQGLPSLPYPRACQANAITASSCITPSRQADHIMPSRQVDSIMGSNHEMTAWDRIMPSLHWNMPSQQPVRTQLLMPVSK